MQVDEGAAVAEEGLAGHPLESHAFTEEVVPLFNKWFSSMSSFFSFFFHF